MILWEGHFAFCFHSTSLWKTYDYRNFFPRVLDFLPAIEQILPTHESSSSHVQRHAWEGSSQFFPRNLNRVEGIETDPPRNFNFPASVLHPPSSLLSLPSSVFPPTMSQPSSPSNTFQKPTASARSIPARSPMT
jgi:hypothetical protein